MKIKPEIYMSCLVWNSIMRVKLVKLVDSAHQCACYAEGESVGSTGT